MGRFSWLGGRDDPKADAESIERARKHRTRRPDRAAQRFADDGRCPDGFFHTGRCRHR